ncbi:MAG: pyrimidine 5'-nucleotidase [Alphaproteobacteria bacterium]|nr:pyrimidine 5'-nucleotidase [Alphaproteobacteria bacterium]
MDTRFSHIDTWVFDLDNTLYDAEAYIFVEMGKKMNGFVAERLNIPLDEADGVRHGYFRKYGTTLRGLMTEHGVHPDDFLDAIHDIDITRVPPCKITRDHLAALPGRRVVFTNAPNGFAREMTAQLGIDHLFDGIFGIEDADYWPKPHADTYHVFLKKHGIDPARACMFEDMAVNLKPARDLGMTTVWLHGTEKPETVHDHVQHSAPRLPDWLQTHVKLVK